MFFHMLKNDLRNNKGLDLILFVFMTAACVLVFAGAAQVYSSVTGTDRTNERCKVADGAVIFTNGEQERTYMRDKIAAHFDNDEKVLSYALQERVRLSADRIDLDNSMKKTPILSWNARSISVLSLPMRISCTV